MKYLSFATRKEAEAWSAEAYARVAKPQPGDVTKYAYDVQEAKDGTFFAVIDDERFATEDEKEMAAVDKPEVSVLFGDVSAAESA